MITWPPLNPDSESDEDEDDVSVEAMTQVMAYFRTFIEHGVFLLLLLLKFVFIYFYISILVNAFKLLH